MDGYCLTVQRLCQYNTVSQSSLLTTIGIHTPKAKYVSRLGRVSAFHISSRRGLCRRVLQEHTVSEVSLVFGQIWILICANRRAEIYIQCTCWRRQRLVLD